MIDQAGILMAQGLGIASERIQGVNDNMSLCNASFLWRRKYTV